MTRRLPALALLLCTACSSQAGPDVVVLVSIDTLRADHVGLLGADRALTPNIDAFFRAGSIFEGASSPAPCTVPAVRQMLSGGYDLAPERPHLAEILRRNGFHTAASTSQHMFLYDESGGYARGFDVFENAAEDELDRYGMSARTADRVVERAVKLVEQWGRQQPLFLWLHFFDPHDPYTPPERFRILDAGNTSRRTGHRRAYLQAERPNTMLAWMEAGHIFSEQDVAHYRNLYAGEIAFVDEQLGRFFDFLEREGLAERALVVLTSDHGEWLGEGDAWDHCRTLHGRELRVPLLVRDADGPLAGIGRSDEPVSTLDVLPTILARQGLELPDAGYHGVDLAGSPAQRVVAGLWRSRKSARDRHFKLLLRREEGRNRPVALYRIDTDPAESLDLKERCPQIVARLAAGLEHVPELEERLAQEFEETMELLVTLGYVDDPEAPGARNARIEADEPPASAIEQADPCQP